jgi:seryl-tRNA synthetase
MSGDTTKRAVMKETVNAIVNTDKQKRIYQEDINKYERLISQTKELLNEFKKSKRTNKNKYERLITQAEELIEVFKTAKSIAENLVDEMDEDLNGLNILMDLYKKIRPTDGDEIYNNYKIVSKKFINVEDTTQYKDAHKRAYDNYREKYKYNYFTEEVSLGFYDDVFIWPPNRKAFWGIEKLINLKELHITNNKITSLAGPKF